MVEILPQNKKVYKNIKNLKIDIANPLGKGAFATVYEGEIETVN